MRRVVVVAITLAAVAAAGCRGSSSDSDKSGSSKSTAKDTPQKFLDKLDAAARAGDTDTRVALLHPAVIARYGEQQCRDFLAEPQAVDPTRKDKVKDVDKPRPFEFTTDDGAIPVPNAQRVLVEETYQRKKSRRELHLALVDGGYRYFIDCGVPLNGQ